jgi:hypothetical protein
MLCPQRHPLPESDGVRGGKRFKFALQTERMATAPNPQALQTAEPMATLIAQDIKTWDNDKLQRYAEKYWRDDDTDVANIIDDDYGKIMKGPVDERIRDAILNEMTTRKLAIPKPQEWIERRDEEYGLYPDVSDPNFAARLARKTEFYELRSEPVAEDSCQRAVGEFSATSIQRLVARFLHPDTPYNGVLLYHGVGVGKTCSAVTVAETFLETMPYNKVYIIAPQAIAEGFRRTIFDVNRLVPTTPQEYALTKELWKSPQCTGMTYVRLADMAKNRNKDEIAKEVDKLIKQRFQIMGYLKFANWVNDRFKEIPDVITGAARDDRKIAIIRQLFADHLIIIDEAHNLRDADPGDEDSAEGITEGPKIDEPARVKLSERAEGKRLTPILQDILRVADGLRLMLMTATPMYNTAPEIVFLLNLLTLNDTKDDSLRLEVSQVFQGDGEFKEGGAAALSRLIKRYVSYMRGENPNTFPVRLTPAESNIGTFIDVYPTRSISRKETRKRKTDIMGRVSWGDHDKNIMKSLPLCVHSIKDTWAGENLRHYLKKYHTQAVDEGDRGAEITDFILDRTMQMGNIYYKNGTYGREGWNNYFKEVMTVFRTMKVKQFRWNQDTTEANVAPLEVSDIFGKESIAEYAPKIAAIVDLIDRGEGISFVYSRYVTAGALPIAIALELRGWVRVLADGTPAPLLIQTGAPRATKYYILLTSDETLSPNFSGGALLRYATTFKNMDEVNGSKVKAIIGSQVASEGLDLKCVRQIHLLDGWYHLNRIEQIEGRGVRFCSHVELPLEKRNCLIYLHAVDVGKYETADLYAYRLAVRKAQPIGRVSRLMKINAWDCVLNLNAVLLKNMGERLLVDALGRRETVELKDEPFTSLCDYIGDPAPGGGYECKPYVCAAETTELGADESTQKSYNFRRVFLERQQLLINYFKTETVLQVDKILKLFYNNIPESFARIGLRDVLNKVRIHRNDGIYGTLKLVNDYVVFQPEGVTNTMIPMALRYGRAYGRMPREFEPPRGTLLATEGLVLEPPPAAAVVAAPATTGVAAASAVVVEETDEKLATDALKKLAQWDKTLTLILAGRLTGVISETESLLGWRWVFRFFRHLADVRPIAYHWFMENFWTYKEQLAVFRAWLTRGINTLVGYEKVCASVFMKENHRIELFQKDKTNRISGCVIYNLSAGESGSVQTYCQYGGSISQCTAVFKDDVNAILGAPIDRKEGTGPYFGFLVSKQKTIVFKTVDKEKGDIKGAECANTSNLGNHEKRIRALHDIFRKAGDPIVDLLLDDAPAARASDKDRKDRQKVLTAQFETAQPSFVADSADPLKHTGDLTLKQICPYMEFLLRYADRRAVGGVRWFLSVVDSARAGVKMT